jgi:hypothetical protein
MSRFERRAFFERLCELREAYGRKEHEGSELTVAATIDYVTSLMDDPSALDAVLGSDATESPTTTTSHFM